MSIFRITTQFLPFSWTTKTKVISYLCIDGEHAIADKNCHFNQI